MDEHGSFPVPLLGLHVELRLREGRLAGLGLRPEPVQGGLASPEAQVLRARIEAHLTDGRDDFADVAVDLGGVAPFHQRVLTELRRVRPGGTVTYGELARRLGQPGASRAVGAAMAANPIPVVLPCHRVVQADGSLGNYSGHGGVATKLALLRIEGARF